MSDTDFNYILKGKDLNDKSFLYIIYIFLSNTNSKFSFFLQSGKYCGAICWLSAKVSKGHCILT